MLLLAFFCFEWVVSLYNYATKYRYIIMKLFETDKSVQCNIFLV